MNEMNEQHERANGDKFIEWFNVNYSTCLSYQGRADVAPDLVYSSGDEKLLIEVTTAYYDRPHAEFLWDGAKSEKEQNEPWIGVNPDKNLASAIMDRISDKSLKDYGQGCILIIVIPPGVTSHEDLSRLLESKELTENKSEGIYVVGTFPYINDDRTTGGYRVITLKRWGGTYAKNRYGTPITSRNITK